MTFSFILSSIYSVCESISNWNSLTGPGFDYTFWFIVFLLELDLNKSVSLFARFD